MIYADLDFPTGRFASPRNVCASLVLLLSAASLAAQDSSVPRFEPDIAPILNNNCVVCHGDNSPQAELDTRTREALLKGGKSGPALVPGTPVDSLLLQKIASGAMPMGDKKLAPGEVDLIRRWIEAGALLEGEDAAAGGGAGQQVNPREILVTTINVKCLLCHGRRRQEGGLDLRTRASAIKGGASGPAIVPGNPDASLMIKRITAEEMPPEKHQARLSYRPITSGELETLRRWITDGAPWDDEKPAAVDPASDPMVSDEDRGFWSFQPPRRPAPPDVRHPDRVRQPIDTFLLAKLEEKDLTFSPDAERLTLMRRAYFGRDRVASFPRGRRSVLGRQEPGQL